MNQKLLLLSMFLVLCISNSSIAQTADEYYLFAYFKDNGQDGLHLAYSKDGLIWSTLNSDKSFLRPVIGDSIMRDPSLYKDSTGTFHLVWTCGWWLKGFGYARSNDLINWSNQNYVPVMENEQKCRNTWAPEIFWDKKIKNYMVIWASTIDGLYAEGEEPTESKLNHRLYFTLTKDFATYGPKRLLYDPGFSSIDAALMEFKGKYLLFLKDERKVPTKKNIRFAESDTATCLYGNPSLPITGNYWAEGCFPIVIGDRIIVYFDKYTQGSYGAVTSSNLRKWEDISDKVKFPIGVRHGSFIKVDKALIDKLKFLN